MDKFLETKLNTDDNKEGKINLEPDVCCDQLDKLILSLDIEKLSFKEIHDENLHLSYNSQFLSKRLSSNLLNYFENNVTYYEGDLAKVRVFGKWHKIPRKQTAFGNPGLMYKFSGITVPSKNWPVVLEKLRNVVSKVAECEFNFVLVNRYKSVCLMVLIFPISTKYGQ